jgi:hypothetical protein
MIAQSTQTRWMVEPNQIPLTSNAAQPDLARPNWTVETRRPPVIS